MKITTQGRLLPLAAALALTAAPASALSIEFDDGTTAFTVADGGGMDDDRTAGRLEYTSASTSPLAGWRTLSAMATSCRNAIDCPNLTLDFEVDSGGAAADLYLRVTETDLTLDGGRTVFDTALSGTAQDRVEAAFYYDPSNTPFGQAVQIDESFAFASGGDFSAYSRDGEDEAAGASPFSLTTVYRIVHEAGGTQTLGDSKMTAASASPVPVPAALPLLAGGLGVSGLALRRRRGRA
ncbi:hypothetical protein [Albimonas pacifica]|nr:hypothetical protein [Albimonas pacifica]